MQVDQLRAALRRHRLASGLSYEALAQDIAVVVGRKHRMSLATVQRFIEGTSGQPNERTLYAISEYLKSQGVAA